MSDIKIFNCGKCGYIGTRHGLREHLKKEHLITKKITNVIYSARKGYIKQPWWKEE